MKTWAAWMCAIISATVCIGCGEGKMDDGRIGDDPVGRIPASAWEKLSGKRIFFGHQSVGHNIMQGVRELMTRYPAIRLSVVDLKEGQAKGGDGVFAHAAVGRNQHPASKIEGFRGRLQEGGAKGYDIALLKFCYVDIVEKTDVDAGVAEYAARMDEIRKEHPGILVVHVTVPLTNERPSWKNTVRKWLGRKGGACAENVRKNEYNERLVREYGGKEPIFDLAAAESTREDGSRSTCSVGGKSYFCLVPEYTDDGGHLNARGRRFVAGRFLAFLADLAEKN